MQKHTVGDSPCETVKQFYNRISLRIRTRFIATFASKENIRLVLYCQENKYGAG